VISIEHGLKGMCLKWSR